MPRCLPPDAAVLACQLRGVLAPPTHSYGFAANLHVLNRCMRMCVHIVRTPAGWCWGERACVRAQFLVTLERSAIARSAFSVCCSVRAAAAKVSCFAAAASA